jgi:hypothetical protein
MVCVFMEIPREWVGSGSDITPVRGRYGSDLGQTTERGKSERDRQKAQKVRSGGAKATVAERPVMNVTQRCAI